MAHIQAKFITALEEYAVSETPFSVIADAGPSELGNLIKKLIQEKHSDDDKDEQENHDIENLEFDFLINNELLINSLMQHMDNHGLSSESVIIIEYILKQTPPEPENTIEHDDWISCIHANEKIVLTGCYDSKVYVRETKDCNLKVVASGHTDPIKALTWVKFDNNEKSFVSTSLDQNAILWKWNEEHNAVKPVFCCKGHSKSVDCVAAHPDQSKFCTGSWDQSIKLWSASLTTEGDKAEEESRKQLSKKKRQKIEQRGATRTPLLTLAGHREAVSGVEWISNIELCSVSWDHSLKVWDIENASEVSNLKGPKVFLCAKYSQNNKLIATGNTDRHIRLWDPRSSEGAVVKCNLTSHHGWVTCLHWSPNIDTQLVSGSLDSQVKLWDTRSPKAPLYDVEAHEDKVMSLDWSLSNAIFSGGADSKLYKYNVK